jgi:hypothetical protein
MAELLAGPTLEIRCSTAGHGGARATRDRGQVGRWGKGEGGGWGGGTVNGREILAPVYWGRNGVQGRSHRQGSRHQNWLRGVEPLWERGGGTVSIQKIVPGVLEMVILLIFCGF